MQQLLLFARAESTSLSYDKYFLHHKLKRVVATNSKQLLNLNYYQSSCPILQSYCDRFRRNNYNENYFAFLPTFMATYLAEHNYIANGLDLQGPIFLHEPPHRVEFSNNSGGLIECSGHGSPPPEVEWTPVPPQQDMVFTLSNGSLMFYPFSAEKYRHEVHATVYRCKLRNLVGTVLSREIHVRGDLCQKGHHY
uniref:Ig-like domain-containing protein n=1 Tax=Glossina austeni TaxID=7395 RepID=A0A1A9UKT0_GLOAU